MRTIEDKNIPSRGTGFNPGSINSFITIYDYDEEYDDDKDTRPNFQHGLPSGHPA